MRKTIIGICMEQNKIYTKLPSSDLFVSVTLTSTRWPSYTSLTRIPWRYTGCTHRWGFRKTDRQTDKLPKLYTMPLRGWSKMYYSWYFLWIPHILFNSLPVGYPFGLRLHWTCSRFLLCFFCLKTGLISKISYRYRIDFENLTVTHLWW